MTDRGVFLNDAGCCKGYWNSNATPPLTAGSNRPIGELPFELWTAHVSLSVFTVCEVQKCIIPTALADNNGRRCLAALWGVSRKDVRIRTGCNTIRISYCYCCQSGSCTNFVR